MKYKVHKLIRQIWWRVRTGAMTCFPMSRSWNGRFKDARKACKMILPIYRNESIVETGFNKVFGSGSGIIRPLALIRDDLHCAFKCLTTINKDFLFFPMSE